MDDQRSQRRTDTAAASGAPSEPVDGRRARRQRNRDSIVHATFELILDGKGLPSAEDVAARAGVSVSSIFRNFDGLADIQQQALELFTERYSHLLRTAAPPAGDRRTRTMRFVRTRLDLYEAAGPLIATARMRSFDNERSREHLALIRAALAAQVRDWFGPEVDGRPPADAATLVSLLDALTSPEVFDLMTAAHARSRLQITRSWALAIETLVAGWPTAGPDHPTNREDRTP